MKSSDVELIQRILAGDETAFASLIRKYQKQVHAQVLRRIGDFHIAEDITQEIFLEVYQRLETLEEGLTKNIARGCLKWEGRERSSLLQKITKASREHSSLLLDDPSVNVLFRDVVSA